MSFIARYDGRCGDEDCRYDGRIRPGDEIEWADHGHSVVHAACVAAARRRLPRCPDCYLYHVGECL